MAKLLLSLLLSLITVISANAQWQIGFHFSPSFSMDEFKQESNSIDFYGFNFEAAYRLKDSPIYLGAAFNYSIYGSKLDKSSYVDNSGQTMRVRTNNNLISNRLFIRLQPDLPFFVQPYLEAAGGYNFFYTREKIRPRIFSEVFDAETLHHSGAFIYGFGGGLITVGILEVITIIFNKVGDKLENILGTLITLKGLPFEYNISIIAGAMFIGWLASFIAARNSIKKFEVS